MTASAAGPLPTQQQFSEAMSRSLGDAEGADAAEVLKARLLMEHGVERVEDLPVNWNGISLQESEERSAVVFDRLWGQLYDAIESQQSFLAWMGLVSPAFAVKTTSERLAGSDFSHHRAFLSQAESHRRLIQKALNDDITRHPDRGSGRHLSDRELWEQIPEFRFVPPQPFQVLRDSALSLIALVAWLVIAGMLLWTAGRTSMEARA
jgi:ABC-2 type transport system permease protein